MGLVQEAGIPARPPVVPPLAAIVNTFSATNCTLQELPTSFVGAKKILSGALTAGTLATVLSLTTGGVLKFLMAHMEDGTSRTLRLRLTLDGVVVFDSTSVATASPVMGMMAVGSCSVHTAGFQSIGSLVYDAIPFQKSCLVEMASSLSETDKISALVVYDSK